MSFKEIPSKPNFPKLEEKILRFWRENDTLQKYLEKNKASKKRFSFLDGPITANNPMGVHHAWGRTLKDLYQRYKNMQGFRERFQNGFDNQGLWVEVEVEKKLGFKSKKDIEKYGIAKFVEKCKEHTLYFAQVQIEQSKRLGYFMDWGDDYYTMSDENNYAIWHFLKKVWEDGNLYKGRDSVPWCSRCGTAISQHEILTEEYQELTHKSIYFELPIVGRENERFLVWTTTPWTLPANVALAVNPELEYWLVKGYTGINFWIARSLAKKVFGGKVDVVKKVHGEDLVGLRYQGPFDGLEAAQAAKKENPETFHTVVASKDLVSGKEGSGIVHIATGCGTEDFRLGEEKNLSVLPAIDEDANYLEGFGDLTGKNAKENPQLVLDYPLLKVKVGSPPEDFIFKIEPHIHRYPVCWRCKTELVWRVVDEWYIAMDDKRHTDAKNYRKRLQEVIKDVRWIPEFGYDRELDWLRNMEDWLISKKRYWGLALPIWECVCGHFEIIGSKEELQEKAVEGREEFEGHTPHRPWVDKVKIKCPKCGKLVSRIPEVGNPWLDAGIVSFSTLKYFEDRSYWRKWFPADFVLECFPGQFKNWFYSLLAMSTVLEDKAPFKTLLGHASVHDEHGEEMHKSKGNAIEFSEAAEKMGADVMRWMYVCQNPTLNLNFGYGPAEQIKRRFLLILWNCYKFFVTYAKLDEFNPLSDMKLKKGEAKFTFQSFEHTVLDIWVLSRLNELIKGITSHLENYENHLAARAIESFVVDDFSTWYVRRIRDRVGPTVPDSEDKKTAHRTLYSVLLILSKLLAPFAPFLAEEIYQNLMAPQKDYKGRKSAVQGAAESVHLTDWPPYHDYLTDGTVLKKMELVRQICEKGHAERKAAGIKVRQPLAKLTINNLAIQKLNSKLIDLIKDELNVKEVEFKKGKGEIEVVLDTKFTNDLIQEGMTREITRAVQDLRKQTGYRLDDKIKLFWQSDSTKIAKAFESFSDFIAQKTLAKEVIEVKAESKKAKPAKDAEKEVKINDSKIWLATSKI